MGSPAPAATVIAPVYRHTPYLEPALRSILALDYSPLQIVIIDDASPDDAFDVVRRLVAAYDGPHEVIADRNAENLSMGTYNALMARATADHIIVAHDDDIQHPDRVRRVMDVFAEHDPMMVVCDVRFIDADGAALPPRVPSEGDKLFGLQDVARLGRPPVIRGPALSWHRDVFDRFGPIDTARTVRNSDSILPFRAALLGDIYFLDEILLDYRQHPDSRGRLGNDPTDVDATRFNRASEHITQLSYQLHTLDEWAATSPDRADELALARGSLVRRLEDLSRELATHGCRLQLKKKKMSWVSQAPGATPELEIARTIGQLRTERKAAIARTQALTAKTRTLRSQLKTQRSRSEALRKKMRALRARVAGLEASLAQTRRSASWRVTAPLRALRRAFRR